MKPVYKVTILMYMYIYTILFTYKFLSVLMVNIVLCNLNWYFSVPKIILNEFDINLTYRTYL